MNSTGGGLAGRYAAALYAQASELDALDATVAELESLGALIDASADMRRLLDSPLVNVLTAQKAAAAVLEAQGFSTLVRNFVGVVVQNRRPAFAPAITPALRPRFVRPAAAVAATPAVRGASFGNPAIRVGTHLALRMDGPVGSITGAGTRGNAILLTVPGRRSLDLAAQLARLDGRILNAGVMNRAAGAELTLRFREAAPPFFAHNMLA